MEDRKANRKSKKMFSIQVSAKATKQAMAQSQIEPVQRGATKFS